MSRVWRAQRLSLAKDLPETGGKIGAAQQDTYIDRRTNEELSFHPQEPGGMTQRRLISVGWLSGLDGMLKTQDGTQRACFLKQAKNSSG
jgi:hypothetical protein